MDATAVSFPREVIDHIIQQGGLEALKTCSLLSHYFLHTSRKQLFYTITITDGLYAGPGTPDKGSEFLFFWTKSSHLHPHNRVVRLSWHYFETIGVLEAFLSQFIHLPEEIHPISNTHQRDSHSFSFIDYLARNTLNMSDHITRLVVKDISILSPLEFASFPNLKSLSILNHCKIPFKEGTGDILFDKFPPKPLYLDELEIGLGISPATLTWLERSISYSQLRTLKLRDLPARTGDDYSKLTSLVKRVAPTIRTLSYEPSNEDFEGNSLPSCFPSFLELPQLQKLVVYHQGPHGCGRFLKYLSAVLPSLPSTISLDEILVDLSDFSGLSTDPDQEGQIIPGGVMSPSQLVSFIRQKADSEDDDSYRRVAVMLESANKEDDMNTEKGTRELDVLSLRFVEGKRFGVVSKRPKFFLERLPRLREKKLLVLYEPSPFDALVKRNPLLSDRA